MKNKPIKPQFRPELAISLIALVLSLIATVSSIYFSNLGLKTNVLPTLVFIYNSANGWSVKNVGNGPALNVIIAHQNHGANKWQAPTRLYPLAAGDKIHIKWVGRSPNKLMATYADVHNRNYTSLTDEDLTTIESKSPLIFWDETEISKIWERQ